MARRFFTARSIRRFFTARSIRILVLLNRRRIRWLVAILGVSVLLLACVLIFPSWLYPSLHSAELVGLEPVERVQAQAERLKLQNDLRTTALQPIAGLAVLAGAVLAFQQLTADRQQATATLFAARSLGIDARLYDGSFEEWSRLDGAVEK